MCDKRFQNILIVILCLVCCRGLIYGLLIPFDRSPDEKLHFQLIKAKQLQLEQATKEERQHTAAQLELTSRLLLYPEMNPQKYTVQDFSKANLPGPPSSRKLYYLISAWILKLLSLDAIDNEIYVIRGFSILCGVLVVFFSFLVTRELFPGSTFMMVGVPIFITFIPQFSAMNGVINNDKLVEVFAAVLFWLMVRIFKHGLNAVYFAAYLVTMGLTLFSKRTAVFLLPFSLVFLLVYYWKSSLGIRMHLLLLGLFLGLVIGGYGLLWNKTIFLWIDEHVISIPPINDIGLVLFRPELYTVASLKYYAKFFTLMYWSFWGVFGYMTIHLHHGWYLITAFVQGLAIVGLGKFVVQVKTHKITVDQWKAKVLYLFAVSIVLAVMMMFSRSILFRLRDPVLVQGRYLFTVIIPISILTMLGLQQLVCSRYLRWVSAIGLIGLIVLDLVCLSNYILLNFHARSLWDGVVIGRENQDDIRLEIGLWTAGTRIEQTFVASQNNLCRLDFFLDSYNPWDSPYLDCRLFEITTTETSPDLTYDVIRKNLKEIRHKRINGWLLSGHMFNSFWFTPIADSQQKWYLLAIESPGLKKGGSSIVLASPRERYEQGNLFVNGEQKQGDLAFRALYRQPRIKLLQESFARLGLYKPPPFSKPAAYYGLFAGYMLLLLGFSWAGYRLRKR